ncbi:hypothetical protein DPMN_055780 [Dreissena polymorpha]|uniref:Uncharacterized protein n=1 Tax=Dreissena polymorpha TaxID=45954 RepID=A0A9D4CSF6_DREPO|nr:hypothetical protein DPMN_055780 [Dreissena polymorpha]
MKTMTSTVYTNKLLTINILTKFHKDWKKTATSIVYTSTGSNIIRTNLLTKFHIDRKINEKCPAPGSHIFQPTGIIFSLVQYIIGMNLLTKFHEDRTVNVASREKSPTPWEQCFSFANIIIFELIKNIIETNLLTKFH